MSEHEGHGDFKFLLGLFFGGIIGAVIIFFLGTKEGRKAGKELKEKGEEAFDDISDKFTELEKKGEEIKDQVGQKLEEKKEVITEVATEKIDTALAQIEQLQAQGQQTTAELRKRLFRNLPPKKR